VGTFNEQNWGALRERGHRAHLFHSVYEGEHNGLEIVATTTETTDS
jgi:hypothetical protein